MGTSPQPHRGGGERSPTTPGGPKGRVVDNFDRD
jgi:hypothetical protein